MVQAARINISCSYLVERATRFAMMRCRARRALRALKKGMSHWNMRVVHGAPQAAQRDGSSMTSSGAA